MASDRRKDDDPLRREDLPGELEHASGEVEGAEAAIVAGAGGEVSSVGDDELAVEAEEAGTAVTRSRRTEREVAGPKPQGNRVLNFLRASWAELQRVQWPDRKQVAQATAVVLGFVAIAGAYLGAADWAARQVVDFII
jgi:preprotein translocase SecE subunit